jgi:uncharacterized protein YbjT (DUF2867 family)
MANQSLQGSHILSQLLSHSSVSQVHALTRRTSPHPIVDTGNKLRPLVSTDTSAWPNTLRSLSASVFISALGSTRADEGSLEAQRKIDYQLNLDLARAAKESGAKTYVLISSGGADSSSRFPYLQMKGQLEDDVVALGFEKTAILRPGVILGAREKPRALEQPLHYVANFLGILNSTLKNCFAQDAETIARAAVRVALEEGLWEGKGKQEAGKRVWMVSQAEIVEIGR